MVRDTLTCKLICCCCATHHDNNQTDINNENSEKNCNLNFGLSIFFSFLFIIPAIILLLNQDKLQKLNNSILNSQKFISRAKSYTDMPELTPEILRQFIDKIIVYDKDKKYSRTANQKIEIYYRDIGHLADYTKENDIQQPANVYETMQKEDLIKEISKKTA